MASQKRAWPTPSVSRLQFRSYAPSGLCCFKQKTTEPLTTDRLANVPLASLLGLLPAKITSESTK